MNTKLNHDQDWLALAKQANWSAAKLARLCGVSVRTLERFFLKEMGKRPKKWLAEQRQHQAAGHLKDGLSVKETAARLDYKYAHHFSREFKEHWGICATQMNSGSPELDNVAIWYEMARLGR